MIVMTSIFWISVFLIVYTYGLYPGLLFLLSRGKKRPEPPSVRDWPGVSILIAAYNEERHIKERVENCLSLDYPRERLEIVIASDGSQDRTGEIVRGITDPRVVLWDYQERRGKVNVLNESVARVKNDLIVFSDANTYFQPDAVKKLVRHFHDPKVGCVCGALRFVNAKGSRTGDLEGAYWRFETMLKEWEGQKGSLLGANGGIYAIQKNLYWTCPPDTIVEDFVIPMKILQQGYEVRYEPEAVAREEAARHIIQEKKRRIRIGVGDYQAIFLLLPLLNPLRGFPALAFFSHKVVRWFVPFFLILAFISNGFLWDQPFYQMTFLLQGAFYGFALIGQALSWSGIQLKMFSLCYYFVSMNLALFLGFVRFLTGGQRVTWERTER